MICPPCICTITHRITLIYKICCDSIYFVRRQAIFCFFSCHKHLLHFENTCIWRFCFAYISNSDIPNSKFYISPLFSWTPKKCWSTMIQWQSCNLTCTTLIFIVLHQIWIKFFRYTNNMTIIVSNMRKLFKITCVHWFVLN